MFVTNTKTAGFSLVEMAIVVTIMGVLAGGMLAVSSNKIEKTAVRTTAQKLHDIDDRIKVYYARYGKIPCPAIATAEEGTSAYGMAIDCSSGVEDYPAYTVKNVDDVNQVVFGNVPVRTLGLPESMMYDEWGSRIMYGAVVELAKSRMAYTTYTTTATDGVIKIVDGNGNQVLDPLTTNVVPYVLISYGKDKKGALGRKMPDNGIPRIACGSGKEGENCDFGDQNTNNAVIMDTNISDAKDDNSYYYDLVRWTTRDRLKEYDVGLADVKDIKGYSTKCAIKKDDTLWCWGDNQTKILGNLGEKNFSDVPVSVGGKSQWSSIDMAEKKGIGQGEIYSFICGIKTDKTLWCWGDGRAGYLGTGAREGYASMPLQVKGGGLWKSVHTSYQQVCGIKTDDTLWCWGVNAKDDSVSVADEPTQIDPGHAWKSVSVGATKSCGIQTDNSLWCWDVRTADYLMWDRYWELTAMSATENILAGEEWKQVDVAGGVKSDSGSYNPVICAIKLDETLWCWGDNRFGQLGDGTTTEKSVPTLVSGGSQWKDVFVESSMVCATKFTGTLWCWGSNQFGQLGINSNTDSLVPVQVHGGGLWKNIYQDDSRTCAIKADDTLWCWGDLRFSQGGKFALPTEILVNSKWKTLSQVSDAICAIRDDGKAYCWGYGVHGEMGNAKNLKENGVSYIELRP
jgi:prepilin-type N-terminal cleavage/methylation domain-containing protein